uniref:SCP domain-containing protein n=1 Tax=Ascaris lumbricoides TaxID=6252 RepID=A0A0M3HP92_ASCLU
MLSGASYIEGISPQSNMGKVNKIYAYKKMPQLEGKCATDKARQLNSKSPQTKLTYQRIEGMADNEAKEKKVETSKDQERTAHSVHATCAPTFDDRHQN